MSRDSDIRKIEAALAAARETVSQFTSGRIESELKSGGDPVTEADVELDNVLKASLLEDGEGWLSEETRDDAARLDKRRVWIVDPLDGTREFIEGIDQWCISIGLCEDGQVVAGGICNPASEQTFIGSRETGLYFNGKQAGVSDSESLEGIRVLASRSEIKRGQWQQFADSPFEVVPCGSVAYKLAMVSAGLAEATFTLVPKNEWDIAAGVLLVQAGGGLVAGKNGEAFTFNNADTKVSGLIAAGKAAYNKLTEHIAAVGAL